ncbi:MOB kinase activator 3A [Galdieria sulphuraria]|uniref:Maintenance of ploidy protein MOB1 (MPS1 binder 1) n=1 Tax=Galdieria sulphuraria TaxID=130081 RepID=M2W6P5_GALSU|nr:maintenance of ploidy protein MOB1 (MPS1 binder 1) [Galdieria sulphuraria]EME31451.1 maintenance of ploidy protein MOB1 (MPS1 binder 1) [Galdieria sulphuraria]GJD06604.1 MOB kinase activator 3A [Galdieria sulphuraria]|eukprot:XP_005707971.1 maintenance of ploidy protein MOB1 (MPS1 binder 1) [Galdieria sulphuraria]
MLSFFEKNKTVKPKKHFDVSKKFQDLKKIPPSELKRKLVDIDVRKAIQLPEGYPEEDWIYIGLLDCLYHVSLLQNCLYGDCTDESCPVMNAGSKYEYLWQDNDQHKKATKVSAPQYISLFLDWAEKLLAVDQLTSTECAAVKSPEFRATAKTIARRLIRIYGHMYYSHWDVILERGAESHLNTCFFQFLCFVQEFGLCSDKDIEPLKDIADKV